VGLQLDRIDRLTIATGDVVDARDALTRLGLTPTTPEHCVFSVGDNENVVAVEFVTQSARDRDAAADPCVLTFVVDDVAGAHEVLSAQRANTDTSGCRFVLVERAAPAGASPNTFPLRRIDHLAVLPADLEAATRYWVEVLGVPMYAQIDTPTLIIRQMKVGDLMVELLAPAGAESHLTGMAPGMRPMIACEVDDVTACVSLARERGFTIPDAAAGFLPGTLTATIAASDVAGLSIQLLQYV
jgi:hypothetical protein